MSKVKKTFLGIILMLLLGFTGLAQVGAVTDLVVLNEPLNGVETEEGLLVYQQTAKSRHNGGTRIDDQKFQAVVKPAGAETVEVISWGPQNQHGWDHATVRDLARDFQYRNPGYKVLAAINADFFHIQGNYEPQNTFISNGDVIKKDARYRTTTRTWYLNTLGFKDDGSYVTGPAYAEDNMTLKLLDGKKVTEDFPIEVINDYPTGDGIAVWYPNKMSSVNVSGYTLYRGTYDLFRESTDLSEIKNITGYVGDELGQELGSFVKGTIQEVQKDVTILDSIPQSTFYLVTKNPSFESKLTPGTYLKCEYNMVGKFADVKNATGYSIQCLVDGVPTHVNVPDAQDYHATSNPRALVGFKPDGSVVFCTIDGRQGAQGAVGVSVYEAGEILRILGCDNGFNLDGGGSATLVVRNSEGGFDVINSPSDNVERKVANVLLFVVRDPKIQITDINTNSITVEQLGSVVDGTIQNVRVKLEGGGKLFDFQPLTDNKIVFNELDRDTKYYISYQYEIKREDGKILKSEVTTQIVQTLGEGVPEINRFRISSKAGTSVTFDFNIKIFDEVTSIIRRTIVYGDQNYDVEEDKGKVTISDLTPGEEYQFKLVVEYLLKGEIKTIESEILTYQPAGGTSSGGGCNMGANAGLISLLAAMASSIFIILRRKH